MDSEKPFSFVMPAALSKGDDGDWKITGLASTASKDLQGEIIDQNGLDLTPIEMKKGIFNWDHKKGPENTVGVIDSYKKSKDGLYLSGRLLKNHSKAKAIYEIMSSLNKADTGRMGMSVEGVIKERAGKDGKVIKKAVIHSCALTMNPVNTDTYASLIKSMSSDESELEFEKDDLSPPPTVVPEDNTADQPLFSTNQVMAILEKALSVSAASAGAPNLKTGGDALQVSNMQQQDEVAADANLNPGGDAKIKSQTTQGDERKRAEDEVVQAAREKEKLKAAKSLKKLSFDLYKSNMIDLLDKLQKLYPEHSRSEIWEAVRDRMERKFPEIKDV